MPIAYLNIGSNKGNSLALIEQAVALIELLCNSSAQRSKIIKSEPWGYNSENQYLNIGIAIETSISPLKLLNALQEIEQSVSPTPHRDSNGNYIDREIDIDIIALDSLVIDMPQLSIPHPRMHLREFVLLPMHELIPDWVHPKLNLTPEQMLEQLTTNNIN